MASAAVMPEARALKLAECAANAAAQISDPTTQQAIGYMLEIVVDLVRRGGLSDTALRQKRLAGKALAGDLSNPLATQNVSPDELSKLAVAAPAGDQADEARHEHRSATGPATLELDEDVLHRRNKPKKDRQAFATAPVAPASSARRTAARRAGLPRDVAGADAKAATPSGTCELQQRRRSQPPTEPSSLSPARGDVVEADIPSAGDASKQLEAQGWLDSPRRHLLEDLTCKTDDNRRHEGAGFEENGVENRSASLLRRCPSSTNNGEVDSLGATAAARLNISESSAATDDSSSPGAGAAKCSPEGVATLGELPSAGHFLEREHPRRHSLVVPPSRSPAQSVVNPPRTTRLGLGNISQQAKEDTLKTLRTMILTSSGRAEVASGSATTSGSMRMTASCIDRFDRQP